MVMYWWTSKNDSKKTTTNLKKSIATIQLYWLHFKRAAVPVHYTGSASVDI